MFPRNATTRFAGPQTIEDQRRAVIFDGGAPPDELRVLSQKPGTTLEENPRFWYSIDESEEAFIYEVGYGINMQHTDFRDPYRKVEWLYPPQTKRHHMDTPTELPARWGNSEHPTCTASKAAGRNSGAARHATLVVVKSMNTAAGKAEVYETIAQDIVSKGRNHRIVVSTSYSDNRVDRPVAKSNSDIMLLVRRGVPVIVGAGNSGPG